MLRIDRIKLFILSLFVVGICAVSLTNDAIAVRTFASSSAPLTVRTGAPAEKTCATSGCHEGELNPKIGEFSIDAPQRYVAGQTYPITVKHATTDPTRRRWGFEITALTSDDKKAGNFRASTELMTTAVTFLDSSGGELIREYVTHNSKGTFEGQALQASWTFEWTAPLANSGPVTFYASGVQADDDGTKQGDQTYTSKVTINPAPQLSPRITGAAVSGKKLILAGENFDMGATVMLNGEPQKTRNDEASPSKVLVVKKGGKKIDKGDTVKLQVRNADGSLTEEFHFARP